jgi:hypothetical protein
MKDFLKKQWEQIAGNVKYAALVLLGSGVIAGFGILTRGLNWWQQAIVGGMFSVVVAWAVVASVFLVRRKDHIPPQTSPALAESPKTEICDPDPRIYLLAILDKADSFSKETPFVVENRGGSVAHGVHIRSLQFGYVSVNFAPVDNIAVNEKAEALPWVQSATTTDQHNIFRVLDDAWNEKGKAQGMLDENFGVSFSIAWANFAGSKRFEVDVDLVYQPIKRQFAERHKQSPKPEVFGIRHSGFRRVSLIEGFVPLMIFLHINMCRECLMLVP